jgi:hypothetical protein
MKKKITQQQNIDELTDKYKLSKAKESLNKLKNTKPTIKKKWINSQTYLPESPRAYFEIASNLTKSEIIERITRNMNL